MQTMTADNLGENRESILYEGPSGTGKTTNAASWPQPQVWAMFDKNLKTIRELIKGGVDASVMIFDTFKEFEDNFVRPALHREFDAQTIIVDTADFMAAMLLRDIQGTQIRLKMGDWGTILNKLRSVFSDLTSTTAYLPDKPSYNVVVNCHLMDVTNDDGALLKTVPKIPGQFKDELQAYLDTVLYCTSQITSAPVKQPGGGTKLVNQKQFLCHSVPPTPFITCKGGGLPPTVEGTYSVLREHWERKEETPA